MCAFEKKEWYTVIFFIDTLSREGRDREEAELFDLWRSREIGPAPLRHWQYSETLWSLTYFLLSMVMLFCSEKEKS